MCKRWAYVGYLRISGCILRRFPLKVLLKKKHRGSLHKGLIEGNASGPVSSCGRGELVQIQNPRYDSKNPAYPVHDGKPGQSSQWMVKNDICSPTQTQPRHVRYLTENWNTYPLDYTLSFSLRPKRDRETERERGRKGGGKTEAVCVSSMLHFTEASRGPLPHKHKTHFPILGLGLIMWPLTAQWQDSQDSAHTHRL